MIAKSRLIKFREKLFLISFFRRLGRIYLRKKIRAYLILKARKELVRVSLIRRSLEDTSFNFESINCSPLIFGIAGSDSACSVKQFLLGRLVKKRFNTMIAISLVYGSRALFAAPKEWRRTLENNGVKTYPVLGVVAWLMFVMAHFGYGIFWILKASFFKKRKLVTVEGKAVYFVGATADQLAEDANRESRCNLASWYRSSSFNNAEPVSFFPSATYKQPNQLSLTERRLPCVDFMPALECWAKKILFWKWSFKAISFCLFELFRGHWWHPVMLQQGALAQYVRLCKDCDLFDEYWFSNSSFLFRPLWTYEAEKKGKLIYLYFYSTNIEGYFYDGKSCPTAMGYRSMTWQRYVVWDNRQLEFLTEEVGKDISGFVVGPILFSDSGQKMPFDCSDRVAVFDIPMRRASELSQLGLPDDFYDPQNIKKFITDIYSASERSETKLIYKRKRITTTSGKCEKFIDSISDQRRVIFAAPEASAYRLIKESKAVISMPFTATSVMARHLGIPCIFYDPTGLLDGSASKTSRDIPVVSGISELESWFKSL